MSEAGRGRRRLFGFVIGHRVNAEAYFAKLEAKRGKVRADRERAKFKAEGRA